MPRGEPTGHGGAVRVRGTVRYVTMFDAVTRRIAHMSIERQRRGDASAFVVHRFKMKPIERGSTREMKVDSIVCPRNADAINLLIDAGGPEVQAWFFDGSKNGHGGPRGTAAVPAQDASTWPSLRPSKNLFLMAVMPRVRNRIIFMEGKVDDLAHVEAFLLNDNAHKYYVFCARRGDYRCVEATATKKDGTKVSATLIVVQNSKSNCYMMMYGRTQDLDKQQTFCDVNAHAWRNLMPFVSDATRALNPEYVAVPRTRADHWMLNNVSARNPDLRSLLASGVTFREVNDRFDAMPTAPP